MSSSRKKPAKIIPIKPESQEKTVSFFEAHKKIYPRSISGRFQLALGHGVADAADFFIRLP